MLPTMWTQARDTFLADGRSPDLLRVRPLRATLAETFADDLRELASNPLPEPTDRWKPLTLEQAVTLLAACRYRTLAYGVTAGQPAEHVAAARSLVDALEVRQAFAASSLFEVLTAGTLALPDDGYGYGNAFDLTGATFEEVVLLLGPGHAALVLWTDED
jgi:hypothetical protein